MWHWQHKNAYKQYALWGKLFFLSSIGHLCVFLLFLFSYNEPTLLINISNKNNAHTRPLFIVHKNTKAALPGYAPGLTPQKNKQHASTTQKNRATTPQKPIVKTPITQTHIPKAAKKATTLKTIAAVKPTKQTAPIKKATAIKKNITPTKPKPVIIAKKTQQASPALSTPPKPVTNNSTSPHKNKVKPVEVAQKTPPIKPSNTEPDINSTKKAIATLTPPEPPIPSISPENQTPLAIDSLPQNNLESENIDLTLVLNGETLDNAYQENNLAPSIASIRQRALQQELTRHWKSPVGVNAKQACTVFITIDQSGATHSIEIVQTSGMLMFDISVQSVCQVQQWPQWTHNKSLTITFH